MAENQKDSQTEGSCARKCGGCKFLAGVLVGLLVAGTGLGIYLAGRCSRHHGCPYMRAMCPMMGQAARAFQIIRLSLALLLLWPVAAGAKTIVLDAADKGQVFEGLGAVSAGASSRLLVDYPEPQRGEILDYLFKPGYGAALQHLKVEIGGDVNSTDGSEPSHERFRGDGNYHRGYEWWLMEEARRRNPAVILDAMAWGAPGWIGDGKLQSQDMADYVADFIKGAKAAHGLDIAYVGIWNEKEPDPAYIKLLRKTLDAEGLSTKIVCCDLYPGEGEGQWAVADWIKKDPELGQAVSVVAAHYPFDPGWEMTTTRAARKLRKPLWSSEDQPNSGGGPMVPRDWEAGGKILAKRYIDNYVDGGLTKTEIWSPVSAYYDTLGYHGSGLMYANEPWSGHYDVQSAIWVTAHTTQFAQPGWRYLDSACGHLSGGGSYVSLRAPDGGDWSVILETVDAKKSQRLAFVLKPGLSTSTVHVWETNAGKTFERVAELEPRARKFSFDFEPGSLYSLTTTTGQGKGGAVPPAPRAFPLPYRDGFETTSLGRAPRYLSDFDGAFEVQPCRGRRGRCLEQVVARKPIVWMSLPEPLTLAGDASEKDYSVSVDVQSDSGPIVLMGRVDSADFSDDLGAARPSGYRLSLSPDGAWTLSSDAYGKPAAVLSSGKLGAELSGWHRAELAFLGRRISASLDGHPLATVEDDAHAAGLFGLGTGWNGAQFDDLAVAP